MNFRTKQFLRKRFQDYYRSYDIVLPPDHTRREWGFILFDEMPDVVMRRHKGFMSESEVLEYIQGMVPVHLYYSAAYYKHPGARNMKEKQWEGADLIFDLDADHLPERATSYAGMLSSVKKETEKLLDFLLEDFGFPEDTVSIVFSGGRGYHIHVRDPGVLPLESAQRREIVDYVSGTGLKNELWFIPEKHKVYDTGKFRKKELESPKRILSFEDDGGGSGWGKRISKYLISFLEELLSKEEYIALGEISSKIYSLSSSPDASKNDIKDVACRIFELKMKHPSWNSKRISQEIDNKEISEEFIQSIFSNSKKARKILDIAKNKDSFRMIDQGYIDFGGVPEFYNIILQDTKKEFGIQLGARTDEPVTADIKRLIRMPSSLHGGSGMRVVPLSLSEFKKFEPLNDAVVFGSRETDIEVISPLKPRYSLIEMKGKTFTVAEGINTLPEYAAIYLMCRGAAEYA